MKKFWRVYNGRLVLYDRGSSPMGKEELRTQLKQVWQRRCRYRRVTAAVILACEGRLDHCIQVHSGVVYGSVGMQKRQDRSRTSTHEH